MSDIIGWIAIAALALWFVTEVLVPGTCAIGEEICKSRKRTNPREREGER